jgi:hypothetical protein
LTLTFATIISHRKIKIQDTPNDRIEFCSLKKMVVSFIGLGAAAGAVSKAFPGAA